MMIRCPCRRFILLPLLHPLTFLLLWRLPVSFSQVLQPLRFRNLGLHLHDERLQFLLTLLTGVGVDVAGVLFSVGPFGRVAPLE